MSLLNQDALVQSQREDGAVCAECARESILRKHESAFAALPVGRSGYLHNIRYRQYVTLAEPMGC